MPILRCPIELKNTSLPSSAFNIWHIRTTVDGTDPGPALSALSTWYTALKGYLAPGTTVVFPAALVDVNTDTEQTIASVPATIAGSGTSWTAPGLAVTFSWKTTVRARRGRGRTFFGPLAASTLGSDGRPSGPFLTTANSATTALVADSAGNTNGWAFGVYGQQSAGIAEPKVLRDVTAYAIGSKVAHLRTRRD